MRFNFGIVAFSNDEINSDLSLMIVSSSLSPQQKTLTAVV